MKMRSGKYAVLLVAQLETQARELFRLGQLLSQTDRFELTYCFYRMHSDAFRRCAQQCEALGVSVMAWPVQTQQIAIAAQSPPSVKQPSLDWLPNWLGYIRHAIAQRHSLFQYIRDKRQASEFLRSKRFDALILPEDGVGCPAQGSFLSAAQDQKISSGVVPYEYSSIEQPQRYIQDQCGYAHLFGMASIFNRQIARNLPQWVHNFNGVLLLRETGPTVLMKEILGIAPPQPWAVHGGRADRLAVESQHMWNHYLRLGIPLEKMCLTGATSDDLITDAMQNREREREKLFEQRGFMAGKPLLLVALPPDYTASRSNQFSDYKSLLCYWCEVASGARDWNVLFQVHPAVTDAQFQFLQSYGLNLVRTDATMLIPLCDALVTSVSSIIRQAIGCGIPVINFDVYNFDYSDYSSLPAVHTMSDKSIFSEAVQKLTQDAETYTSIRAQQNRVSKDWAMLDGQSNHRLIEFVVQLCRRTRDS